ncbi:MAG TPA: glycoside hydrolase family 28 protein [Acidobacteriaceae bacterium]|nr:glycoside hydrolase family 28 protein [Acidobacteriaceae bacterium]
MKARREFLKMAGAGVAGAVAMGAPSGMRAMAEKPSAIAEQNGSIGAPEHSSAIFEVRAFGAKGDGSTIDTPSINRAIEAAAAAGGGTVHFAAGQYLCYSIRLKSNVALHLDQGAVIIAADPLPEGRPGGYDDPEPKQAWEAYQDFGHNHWHNSLIWGEGLHDISIFGPGRIWGRGLVRSNGPTSHNAKSRRINGVGNKSISLKNCHNVTLRGFQILKGGWFGILATGVDNLTIDGLTIDTNRDGMDIDCCRNVRISNCAVNSPWDDAIVPKSSYALGYARATENLEISNCYVTAAYEVGAMLDGTWKKFDGTRRVPHTGRIKLGTESNGGFKNITISNCTFDGCQGLALETVDGALLEDVTISNITMRDIVSAPIFMRLGSRLRGPAESTKTGALRRVIISNVVCSNSASRLGCIISGVPGYEIEDIKLHHIYIQHQGGGTQEQAAIVPPEDEHKYPEPNMFGDMPSQGFYLRHVKNIELSDIEIAAISPDARPAFVLRDVEGADFFHVKTPPVTPAIVLHDSKDVEARWVRGVKDGALA